MGGALDLKSFVPALGKHGGVENLDLLEKDVRIHLLLAALVEQEFLSQNLLFKGGTCLIKCYLGYWRFSEDLDFTWRSQEKWSKLGTKAARREIRPLQRELIGRISTTARDLDLELDDEPSYGASNQMMTLTLSYRSISNLPGFIKLQFNFLEPLLHNFVPRDAAGLLSGTVPAELLFLQEELARRYASSVGVLAYDPREILAEKARAILTRQAPKLRDVFDLYLLQRVLNLSAEQYRDEIVQKTTFGISQRKRYLTQLRNFDDRYGYLMQADLTRLALKHVDLEAFDAYRLRLLDWLREVAEELRTEGRQ